MQSENRRNYDRYPAGHLKVLIKSIRTDDGTWVKGYLNSVDFNRYGIGLETEHCFPIGDHVSLVIRTDDSTLTEISGIVCNRNKSDNIYRCGVRFNLGSTDEDLHLIEERAAAIVH